MTNATRTQRTAAGILAAIAWFALVLQLCITIATARNQHASIFAALVLYFSYLTILTNLLVALSAATQALAPESRWGAFFGAARTQAATASYIAFVGIAYSVLLRGGASSEGPGAVTNELLHVVVPVLFVVYWFAFAAKRPLGLRHIPRWLIYPIAYCAWTLLRGAVVGVYPYHFVDVTALGYPTVFVHSAGLVIAFVLLGALFVGIARCAPQRAIP